MSHPRLDEMVTLYLVSRLSLKDIGVRFKLSHEVVRDELAAAGVEIRGPGNPGGPPAERPALPPGPKPAAELDARHAAHVNAVLLANRRRSFPVCVRREV